MNNQTLSVYYAHSAKDLPYSDWQTLISHSNNVAEMAGRFASIFGAQKMAHTTGLLHDLGKYCPEFNQRLHGSKQSVEHAIAGAKIAINRWPQFGKLVAFCVAGHHAGLANGSKEGYRRSTLKQRLAQQFGSDIPRLDPVWEKEIILPEQIMPPENFIPNPKNLLFSIGFFTRMLYSCLVDADFLDTEAFYNQLEKKANRCTDYPDLLQLQTQFNAYLNSFQKRIAEQPVETEEQKRRAAVNKLRSEILHYAVQQAAQKPGLFTLTVPTGGGKTFTSMAFALEHAKQYDMRRVIYVIPFTSIIEQNAAEFRKAFGELGENAVLEHHSSFDDTKLQDNETKDKLRLASENWDMPVIITTTVQFFESLFADRSSRCRKLHNIAGSVIILDEAQMLPFNFLRPIMAAIDELARNYRCSVVMCTATQPAIHQSHGFYHGFTNVREIAPNPVQLFQQLRRTTVQHIGEQTDEDLLTKLTENRQILIIVNNRRHARVLYDNADHLEGMFILTTLMCAVHRTQILAEIRQRLKTGAPCRIVSTSLIECGVDLDLPLVMRAESGSDSIAQAAGRCNREGKKPASESHVWIFKPEEKWKAPAELGILAGNMRSVVRNFDDLLSPEAITAYFTSVYEMKGSELDKEDILKDHHNAGNSYDFPFQDIAAKFRMIKDIMLPIIIPFDKKAEKLINDLYHAKQVNSGILRQLQRYIVQVPESAVRILKDFHRIEIINKDNFSEQFYCLIGNDLYDDIAGLSWKNPNFIACEHSVIA